MSERYIAIRGSKSAHCCFDATVIDTASEDRFGGVCTVCECFEMEDAEKVAAALNAADPG